MRSLDATGTKMFPSLRGRLFFSYGTCGANDQPYNLAYNTDSFRGQTITIGLPAIYPPSHSTITSDA